MIENKIRFSDIDERLDAEFYKPEYTQAESLLKQLENQGDVVELSSIAEEIRKGIFDIKAREYTDSGIPFIRISDINHVSLTDDEITFIPERIHNENKSTQLNPGDLVIAKSGMTMGKVGWVPEKFDEINVSQDIIAVRLKDGVNHRYLAAYLATCYGQRQMWRAGSQQTHPHLNLSRARDLLIYQPEEQIRKEIDRRLKISYEKREKAKRLFEEADKKLLDYLDFNIHDDSEKCYTAKYSDIAGKTRLDSQYYQPKYTELNRSIDDSSLEFKPVKKICEQIEKGFEPGSDNYKDSGKLFVRVKNVRREGINEDDAVYLSDDVFDKNKQDHSPDPGDVLFTKDGRVGSSTVVTPDDGEFLVANGVVIFSPNKDIDPYYLSTYLNSQVVQMMADRKAIGSTIAHYGFRRSKKIPVPVINQEKQEMISSLVRKSRELRKEADALISESIEQIEKALEEAGSGSIEQVNS